MITASVTHLQCKYVSQAKMHAGLPLGCSAIRAQCNLISTMHMPLRGERWWEIAEATICFSCDLMYMTHCMSYTKACTSSATLINTGVGLLYSADSASAYNLWSPVNNRQ